MLLKLLGNQITRIIRLIIKIIRQFITESIHSWISRGFPVGRWLASVSMLSPLTGRRIELMCVLSRFISAARPPRHCFYSHDALWCVQLFNLHNIHTCTRTCTDENQSMVTPHTQGWGFENSLSFLHYSLSFTCPFFNEHTVSSHAPELISTFSSLSCCCENKPASINLSVTHSFSILPHQSAELQDETSSLVRELICFCVSSSQHTNTFSVSFSYMGSI